LNFPVSDKHCLLLFFYLLQFSYLSGFDISWHCLFFKYLSFWVKVVY
jgi:hypothetical protein